jgi:hypothetical protein
MNADAMRIVITRALACKMFFWGFQSRASCQTGLRTVDWHYSLTRPDDDSAAIRFPVAG